MVGVKKTLEEFISEASMKYNGKFDYSKSVYVNYTTPLIIICPIHGEFVQRPSDHFRSSFGCFECSRPHMGKDLISSEEFIKRASKLHDNYYSYEKSIYTGRKNPLIITCPVHGDFLQTPNTHLRDNRKSGTKSGCKICNSGKNKFTHDKFLELARQMHDHKFEYLSLYEGMEKKIKIRCVECENIFYQNAASHVAGCGCPSCNFGISDTKETFIQKSLGIHGTLYNYEKVVYVNAHTKVIIICNKCGTEFLKTPTDHLAQRSGCSCYSTSKGNKRVARILDKVNVKFESEFKFKDCKHIRSLPFDFAIFDRFNNLVGVIEYQGSHHFKIVNRSKNHEVNKKSYEDAIRNDKIKYEYCKNNNIPLLYLNHYEDKYLRQYLINFCNQFSLLVDDK